MGASVVHERGWAQQPLHDPTTVFSFTYYSEENTMSQPDIRTQLHKQIDELPDEIVEQIVDFTLFVVNRRKISQTYSDWQDDQWHTFALDQFFQDEDEIDYSLDDAQEVYKP